MDWRVIGSISLVVFVVLLRLYGARHVMARQGQFVWLVFAPTLVIGIVIQWTGVQMMLGPEPVVGAVITIAGGLNLLAVLRLLRRMSRSVTSAGPEDDLGSVLTEPIVDYVLTTMTLLLIGAVVALIGLVVFGISQAAG
jgi:hypothetical protein